MQDQDEALGLTEHMYRAPDHAYAYRGFVSSEAL